MIQFTVCQNRALQTPTLSQELLVAGKWKVLERCVNLKLEANKRDTRLPKLSYYTDLLH